MHNQTTDRRAGVNQAIINLCADMKNERAFISLESARQELAEAHGRAPWAVSLAYGDDEKLIGDIQRGRVTAAKALHVLDCARRSGRFPITQMHRTEHAILKA